MSARDVKSASLKAAKVTGIVGRWHKQRAFFFPLPLVFLLFLTTHSSPPFVGLYSSPFPPLLELFMTCFGITKQDGLEKKKQPWMRAGFTRSGLVGEVVLAHDENYARGGGTWRFTDFPELPE